MLEAAGPPFLYLTTTGRKTGLPREIEIWFTRHDGRYYVIAETGERAHWVRNLRADPRVHFRVGDVTIAGRARAIDPAAEPALHARVQALSREKYGWGDGLVVELTPDAPLRPSPLLVWRLCNPPCSYLRERPLC